MYVLLACVSVAIAQTGNQIPDSFKRITENAQFQLFLNETTLAIKVLDKRSGKLWHSNLDEVSEDDQLNKTWTAFATSGISIDYLNQNAKRNRASLSNAEHRLTITPTEEGFEALVEFLEPSISMRLQVSLSPHGLTLEVPFETVQENDPGFKLEQLHLYPFFGATRESQTQGYMFIPDGAGTLIPFADSTKAQNVFYGRYYGPDLGMVTKLSHDPYSNRPYRLSIPVTGISQQEQAFITIVEEGAGYSEVVAHPAGVITRFNFLYNSFIYNQIYFQATNRSGDGLTIIQPKTNAFDIKVQYRFLERGSYVDMALSYQEYLLEQGVLQKPDSTPKDIGLKLEFLGSEKENVLFWWRAIPMTTIDQMQAILEDINIPSAEVVYYGWQPLGASSQAPTSLRLEPRLGSPQELQKLASTITEQGGHFSLYLNPQAAFKNESGYMARRDLAMSITRANIEGLERSKQSYYFNFPATQQRFMQLSQNLADTDISLALDGLGTVLYSDYKQSQDRNAMTQQYQSMLAQNPVKTAFYMPNDYMYAYTRAYFDIPLEDSGYVYTSQSVPFLQIVLAGYIPYYGRALNFSSNLRHDLLKHAEFGAYPSYFLTQEVTANILKTDSNWIYTSAYSQWQENIRQNYAWLNRLLAPVKGATITAHQTLLPGVVATTYSNQQQIIVNYNTFPVSIVQHSIAPQDALIREVSP